MPILGPEQQLLLNQIVEDRRPEWRSLVNELQTRDLTVEERQGLCDMLADEIVATGLGDGDEPNERGLSIEELIDRLNPLA